MSFYPCYTSVARGCEQILFPFSFSSCFFTALCGCILTSVLKRTLTFHSFQETILLLPGKSGDIESVSRHYLSPRFAHAFTWKDFYHYSERVNSEIICLPTLNTTSTRHNNSPLCLRNRRVGPFGRFALEIPSGYLIHTFLRPGLWATLRTAF